MPFNKIWDQSRLPEKKVTSATFQTEKELILFVIDKSYDFGVFSDHSKIYDKYAPEEWKRNSKYFDTEHSSGLSFRSWDYAKLKYLADHCDDADILRAVFESGKVEDESFLSLSLIHI